MFCVLFAQEPQCSAGIETGALCAPNTEEMR